MKILIISPEGRHTAVGKKFKFPFPTAGAPMVAALTPADCEVRIIDEIVEDINFDEKADIVAISSMTPMASRAYEIAAEFRKRGVAVIMGGIHPSACPDEAAEHCGLGDHRRGGRPLAAGDRGLQERAAPEDLQEGLPALADRTAAAALGPSAYTTSTSP